MSWVRKTLTFAGPSDVFVYTRGNTAGFFCSHWHDRMAVDTRKVPRRELHFATLEEALADAETLAAGSHETTGNWSLGQILSHLARTIDANLDGVDGKPPLPMRLLGPLRPIILKRIVFGKSMAPGFTLPEQFRKQFIPQDDSVLDESIAHYRSAVARVAAAQQIPKHPFFGNMSMDEVRRLHLRHAELHLSFARLANESAE